MELVNAELQLQAGEADVTKGLLALNVAQDLFETLVAQEPNVLGSGVGTVTTTSNVEYTAFPTGLLRLDALDYLDPTSSLPVWGLRHIHQVGGHSYTLPTLLVSATVTGSNPWGYWTNGTRIYWSPIPNATYTIRWYGFQAAADITASGTFAYPDAVSFPLSVLAARLMKLGVDDTTDDLAGMATEVVGNVIKTLGNFVRDGAAPLRYTRNHEA